MNNAGHPDADIAAVDAGNSLALETPRPYTEKRRSPRISIRLPILLSWRDGNTETVEALFTASINRYGCALHARTFLQPGTRVKLDFAEKSIAGRVVHSLKDHSNNLVTVGVSFDQDSHEFWPVGFELEPPSL
jgi:hypothetical protein